MTIKEEIREMKEGNLAMPIIRYSIEYCTGSEGNRSLDVVVENDAVRYEILVNKAVTKTLYKLVDAFEEYGLL